MAANTPPARGWRAAVAPPVLAAQFLTAVPLPLAVPAGPAQLGWALAWFPAVGGLLGLALAGVDAAARALWPPWVAAALVLVAGTLLTGGLHLDGLMDTCDGLFGGRTAERRLEIMRDSRVGSYGVLAGALQLLLKLAGLAALPSEVRAGAFVAMAVSGRWGMAAAVWAFPYARPQGLGTAFKRGATWSTSAGATLLAAATLVVAAGVPGLVLLPLAGCVAWLAGAYAVARLGGLSGDCYGAINELVESAVLLAVVAVI
jgi:adenosylcobinamide-GDP ribazoletransferase